MPLLPASQPRRKGAAAVETAVVLIPLFLFLFGIVEYGRFVMVRNLMDNAAREGARLATVSTNGGTTADIEDRVNAALAGQQPSMEGLAIQVYKADAAGQNIGAWTGAASGERIAVKVDATYRPLIPTFGIVPNAIPVEARSIMRSEAP